jgi:phosphoribosylformylglycinamidine synthase
MKFGILVFPGSNCDDDMVFVLKDILGQDTVKIWHKSTDLQGCDCVVLPGGFSYGDYLRSGAIARFSPVMQQVSRFASEGGLVIGICNGFQILTEAGLLPGALLHNNSRKYICKNVHLRVENNQTALTQDVEKGVVLKIPIAHGEGCFYADDSTLDSLEENGQVLFRYCTAEGAIEQAANPNGAKRNIAGICNDTRNVFGMMPHPERASVDFLGNTDGLILLRSFIRHAVAKTTSGLLA